MPEIALGSPMDGATRPRMGRLEQKPKPSAGAGGSGNPDADAVLCVWVCECV